MNLRKAWKLPVIALIGLIIVSVITVVAAANSIASSRLSDQSLPIDINALKPPECAAINVTSIVIGSGTINGTNANELILGSPLSDTIKGKAGSDCILGGGGNDDIDGGSGGGASGYDICIGGPGNDVFSKCEEEYP
jgi:Ca2+-binding RTX toxin-like protein